MLVTTDVHGTLGVYTRPHCAEALAAIADEHHGANPSTVTEITRWFLQTAPRLTEELITEVCGYLMIPRHAFPDSIPSGFTAYPYADEALAKITRIAPVVALSNMSTLTGPARIAGLQAQLGQHLDKVHASYAIATRKPHRRCWQYAAVQHDHEINDVIHIGDSISGDIRGAIHAGCRAAILVNTRQINVSTGLRADPRVAVVPDLLAAVSVLQEWAP